VHRCNVNRINGSIIWQGIWYVCIWDTFRHKNISYTNIFPVVNLLKYWRIYCQSWPSPTWSNLTISAQPSLITSKIDQFSRLHRFSFLVTITQFMLPVVYLSLSPPPPAFYYTKCYLFIYFCGKTYFSCFAFPVPVRRWLRRFSGGLSGARSRWPNQNKKEIKTTEKQKH